MRQIEKRIYAGIRLALKVAANGNANAPMAFTISNTRVSVLGNVLSVKLHGNEICNVTVGEDSAMSDAGKESTRIEFSTCGFTTRITKSRINLIADALGVDGIYQKKSKWFKDCGTYICDFSAGRSVPKSWLAYKFDLKLAA